MKCPVCSKQLKEVRVDDLAVDVCESGCGGIWFDAFELQRVDEMDEVAGAKLVMTLEQVPGQSAPPDKDAKRECPRCGGVKLKKHFFSAKRRIRVDQCPNCAGYWLDHGELLAIRAEMHEKAKEGSKPKELSMEMIRYLYRLRTGVRDSGAKTGRA